MPENEQKTVTPEELAKIKQQQHEQAQPQGAQIQSGGGYFPMPGGSWVCQLWFANLPDANTAQAFLQRIDNAIKKEFSAPQQTNGPAS